MKIKLLHSYNNIIKSENLLLAWKDFIAGKRHKKDAQIFSRNLMDNIVSLHEDLVNHTYQHGSYEDFYVNDPKRRHINKASVRDRLLHHSIYRILYPFFDRIFIPDLFSSRDNRGIHKALNRFRAMFYKVSQNNHHACWVLKCDIRKFFDYIDHSVLLDILSEYIPDRDIMWLLEEVIESYSDSSSSSSLRGGAQATTKQSKSLDDEIASSADANRLPRNDGCSLPLGNLTSQLFANIYMNVFDQFVKHKLKIRYYIRYADDFVFLSDDRKYLENLISKIQRFLDEKLKLTLHPGKIFLHTISSGVDFLGWKHFPDHRILRKTTRERMLRRIAESPTNETLQSYLGLLRHGNSFRTREELLNNYWLWQASEPEYRIQTT